MPRKADEFEVLEKPKRAPRKRVPKVVAESAEEKPKRTRATKKIADVVEPSRRAPTAIKEEQQKKHHVRNHLIVIGALLIVGIGSSAVVGLTDKGQINVAYIIDERNKKAAEKGEQPISANEDPLPDGGLIPADPSTIATSTPQAVATSTASSTPVGNIPRTDEEVAADATATST